MIHLVKPLKITFISISLLLLTACLTNEEIAKNNETAERVKDMSGLISHNLLTQTDHQLHYVSALPASAIQQESFPNRKSVVFVHGTPGSWGTFAGYFEDEALKKDFHLNSIDRPGWGKSGYPGDHFPVYLSSQSALIAPMLEAIWENNNREKIILIGHSLGGSLIPKLAADYPHFVSGIVILAGDLDPTLAEARWFNKALTWVPNFLLPDWVHNSNDEVIAIKPSLAKLQNEFAKITMPVIVLQGTHDELVRPNSAVKATSIFKEADLEVVWLEGAGHIINLTHTNDVKRALYQISKKTELNLNKSK